MGDKHAPIPAWSLISKELHKAGQTGYRRPWDFFTYKGFEGVHIFESEDKTLYIDLVLGTITSQDK